MAILLVLSQLILPVAPLIPTTLNKATINLRSELVLPSKALQVRRTTEIAATCWTDWAMSRCWCISMVHCHCWCNVPGINRRYITGNTECLRSTICSLAPWIRRLKVGNQVMLQSLHGREALIAVQMQAMIYNIAI